MSGKTISNLGLLLSLGAAPAAFADLTVGSGGDADEANQTRVAGAAWVRADDPTRPASPGPRPSLSAASRTAPICSPTCLMT